MNRTIPTTTTTETGTTNGRRRHSGRLLVAFLAAVVLTVTGRPASAQIDLPDFTSTGGLTMVGSTRQLGDRIRLTGNQRDMIGALWSGTRLNVGGGFLTRFQFQISDTGGDPDPAGMGGGDGIAFVIQNSSPTAIGGRGGRIGYDGIRGGIAIELDTYMNADLIGDRDNNHVSIQLFDEFSGLLRAHAFYSLNGTSNIPDLSDGRIHTVTIEYVPDTLRVYIDDCSRPAAIAFVDLRETLGLDDSRAWVGFTSATGLAWENHDLLNWKLSTFTLAEVGDTVICAGDSVTLTIPGAFGRYRWSTGDTTRSITVGQTGLYEVEVTDTFFCSRKRYRLSQRIYGAVLPPLTIAAGGPLTFCEGEKVTLKVEAGYDTYRWSNGAGGRSIAVDRSGKYFVSGFNQFGCHAMSDTVEVIVRPAPRPTAKALGPTTLCTGDSVKIEASPGFSSYRWSTGDTTRTITVRTTGQYRVTVTDANGCPGTSGTVVIIVSQTLVPRIFTRGALALCDGDSTVLEADEGFATYRWSTGDTTRTITVRAPGIYDVTVTSPFGCTGTSLPVTIERRPAPTVGIVADGPISFCDGGSVTLRANGGGICYRWSTGDSTASITVDRAGSYFVTAYDSAGCSAAAAPVVVVVHPLPTIAVTASGPTSFCDGDSVVLTASPGFAEYRWSNGADTREITVRSNGSYGVTGVDTNGCSASASIDVAVSAQPGVVASGGGKICRGESLELSAEGTGSFRWSPVDGLSCTDCPRPTASPSKTTTYVVTATGAGGCAAADTVTVEVSPAVRNIRAHIDTTYHAAIGDQVAVAVVLEDDPAGAGVDELTVTIGYDPTIVSLDSARLAGTLLDGWTITPESHDRTAGSLRVRLKAPAGATLTGRGTLLDFLFRTFLGTKVSSELPFTIELERAPCTFVETRPGKIRIDSICGLNFRLIEIFESSYKLGANSPNPFNPTTEITFSLGLDGHTTLTVLDAAGREVARLVDRHLAPGSYTATWDATLLPSGLYHYRIVSGEWTRTRSMMLVK